jgi:hypothetical protein
MGAFGKNTEGIHLYTIWKYFSRGIAPKIKTVVLFSDAEFREDILKSVGGQVASADPAEG